jgi:hypothetical protein
MTELVVRCRACNSLARVPATAVGKSARCPACGVTFPVEVAVAAIASAPTPEPRTVYPVGHDPLAVPPAGLLYGLALSAFLLPLVWLLLSLLGVRSPVFTLGLPLSIAVGTAGLGAGIALADKLAFATRVKMLLVQLTFAWALGILGFVTKTEWVEEVRRQFGIAGGPWHVVNRPGKPYQCEMPGPPREETVEVIDAWRFPGFRWGSRKDAVFSIAHGNIAAADETEFFKTALAAALARDNGTLQSEREILLREQKGREYVIRLADQATNRMVRVYRLKRNGVVVAAVEGAFLPPDAPEVKRFFNSLILKPAQ